MIDWFVSFSEWLYIISGTGRATAFAGSSTARTFNFQVSFRAHRAN